MKAATACIAVLTTALVSFCAIAQGPGQNPGQGLAQGARQGMRMGVWQQGRPGIGGPQAGRPGVPRLRREQLEEVGVPEETIDAVLALQSKHELARIDLTAALQKAELTLREQMQAREIEQKAALKAVDAVNEARSALFKDEVAAALETRELLGEEVLQELREQRREKIEELLAHRRHAGEEGQTPRDMPRRGAGNAPFAGRRGGGL